MKRFIQHLQGHSYKQLIIYLLVFFGLLTVLSSHFISCDNSYDPYQLGSTGDRERDRDDDDEDCEDSETCADVCELIYVESWLDCNEKEMDEVNELQRVYTRLKQSRVGRASLNEISDEQAGVEMSFFQEYLDTGVDGWLKLINGYSTNEGHSVEPYTEGQAREVITWLVEKKDVAQTLSSVNGGFRVLDALLQKAQGGSNSCFWKGSAKASVTGNSQGASFQPDNPDIDISSSDTAVEDISIRIDDSRYFDLYDLLSCENVGSSSGPDIFTLAANEENWNLFGLAFDLLEQVCRDSILVSGFKGSVEKGICQRAMMCILAIQYESGSSSASVSEIRTWNGWDDGKFSSLDKDQACDLSATEFSGNIKLNR